MSINVVIIVLVVNCFITQWVMKGLKPKVVKSLFAAIDGKTMNYSGQKRDIKRLE